MSLCFVWTKREKKVSNSHEMCCLENFFDSANKMKKKNIFFRWIICSISFQFFFEPTILIDILHSMFTLWLVCFVLLFSLSPLRRTLDDKFVLCLCHFEIILSLSFCYYYNFFWTFSIIRSGNERGNKLSLQRITAFQMLRFPRTKIKSKPFFSTWNMNDRLVSILI